MKKTFVILALLICFCLPVSAAAPLVYDEAGLLSHDEMAELLSYAEEVSEAYECDVIVYTVDDFSGGDAASYAETVFTDSGYGWGDDESGVMLFISMAERDFVILAHGFGNIAFTDHGKAELEAAFLPDLSDGDYHAAFKSFIYTCEEFLELARNGEPVDVVSPGGNDYYYGYEEESSALNIPVLLIVPTIVAGIAVLIMRASMKSAKMQRAADAYIPAGGFKLTGRSDIFTHRTVNRVRRPDPPKSSGGGGTRVNSGGFSSRSGKF